MELEYSSSSAQPLWLVAVISKILPNFLSSSTALCLSTAVAATVTLFLSLNTALSFFIFLFIFRYVRLVVNLVAFCRYKPTATSDSPYLKAKDVTVLVPTVEPYGEHFLECIRSIYANGPAEIIVVTAGPGNHDKAVRSIGIYSNVRVMNCSVQNKRKQMCRALPEVRKEEEYYSLLQRD